MTSNSISTRFPAIAPARTDTLGAVEAVEMGAWSVVDAVRLQEGDAPPPPPSPVPTPGADGVGDPYFPLLGNGGYDARHYTIDLSVDVARNHVTGASTMDAKATQDLSSFNLDFRNFDIDRITVNGKEAPFSRKGGELTVVPVAPLLAGEDFSVAVSYHGKPVPWSSEGAPAMVGWKRYNDGICVDCEPDGASSWFPVNDHPRDKAAYTFKIDVPSKYTVAANGQLVQQESHDDRTRYTWEARDEMASYLAMIQIGVFVRKDEVGPNGLPIRNYFPPRMATDAEYDFGRTGQMIELFSSHFGAYPFEAYGATVVPKQNVGGALECQTMSIFDPFVVTGDRYYENVVAHELAHQWFGDEVSTTSWKDIWLNEGFASYGEWLWQERNEGSASVDRTAREVYDWLGNRANVTAATTPESVRKMQAAHDHHLEQGAQGAIQIGAPPPSDLFDQQVYLKGALVLYALRKEVGDEAFFNGLRAWVAEKAGGHGEIAEFRAVIERVSGKPLEGFFDQWLYQTALPPFPGEGHQRP